MEIRGVASNVSAAYTYKQEADQPKSNEAKAEIQDEYVKSEEPEKKVTYDRPKVDHAAIEKLHQETERAYNYLKQIVAQLLERQGLTYRDWSQVGIDEEACAEASALISEGGELSPEKVSDRIVEFAKAISGGDKSKIDTFRDAIEKGFAEAARVLGGELPEVSQKTYDLVMQKLDTWAQE